MGSRLSFAILLTVFLAACSPNDRQLLQSEIDAVRPKAATPRGECDWASGFVEAAPAFLTCRYVAKGNVASVAAAVRKRLRERGYAVRRLHRAPGAPTAWLVGGQRPGYGISVGLVKPGRPLDWQRDRFVVPPGSVGVHVAVREQG